MPQLMDTCVRNGNYDDALDLRAFISKMAVMHPHLQVFLPPPLYSWDSTYWKNTREGIAWQCEWPSAFSTLAHVCVRARAREGACVRALASLVREG